MDTRTYLYQVANNVNNFGENYYYYRGLVVLYNVNRVDFVITSPEAWDRFKANEDAYTQAANYFKDTSEDMGDNPTIPPKVSILQVSPGAELAPNEWGVVRTESTMGIKLGVAKEGNLWRAVVKEIEGHYSVQVRLLPGVTEVTGIGGNTTEANYCDQITNLNLLGVSAQRWYMISAIQAHENEHMAGLLPTLKLAAPKIESNLESITVANTGQGSVAAAAQIRALASGRDFNTWAETFKAQVDIDHKPGGVTEMAERRTVDPMISSICNHAKAQAPIWGPCIVCP